MTRTRPSRSAVVFAGSLAVGATLAIGGASLALWSDAEHLSGSLAMGYERFAVGAPGADLIPADGGSASFAIDGQDAASTLATDGQWAAAIQVDSLSQGNKGLHYTLTEPDWGEGILGAAAVEIFWVPAPEDCRPGATPTPPPATVEDHTSTPVPATYTANTEAVSEFWCIQAELDALPGTGEYRNLARVTATDPSDIQVESTDDWNALVGSHLDPAEEPDHAIPFTYSTFRPGDAP